MTKTILCKEGYLIPNNHKQIEEIKKELTVTPIVPFQFSFIKTKPPKIKVYQEYDEYISVPKYYGINKLGKPNKNKETIGEKIDIKFNGDLRDKQKEIIDVVIPHIKENDGGVLCLPCAAGKTVLSLYLASYFKVKTLVIVHKTFLLNQWKERAEQFTNAKVGIVQQNKVEIEGKDIVIGMLQSIAKEKYTEEVFKEFGLVIFDEAHHAPSEYFSRALPIIASKLTIGLSATPKRNDGLEKILYWYFGEIMYKMKSNTNNTVLVNIIKYNLDHAKFKEYYLQAGEVNRAKTINKITTIGRLNCYIIDTIEECLKENNKRKILVLSDRIEHLKSLKNRLDNRKITTADFYIGGKKQKDLNIAEKAQVIFGSFGMAAEGLDIPDLNTLFMVTSRRSVEQSVGRVTRRLNLDATPVIYDFVYQIPCFVSQGHTRRKLYKKMGFEIKVMDVYNNEIINVKNLCDINELIVHDEPIEQINNDNIDFID